jgi:acetyl-CoA acetyltransferase
MYDVGIVGIGMTRFTRQAERGRKAIAEEAVLQALRDCSLEPRDIGAIFCGSVRGGSAVGQRSMRDIPFHGAPIINIENACASSSTALREAYAWIKAGFCDVALAFGVEITSTTEKGPLVMPKDEWIFQAGLNLPMWYAMQAARHMERYGSTREQLASVAVKSRGLAARNPKAHFQTETTLEEVLGSRTVADPLTLYQCCPKTDGGSAAIVASRDFIRRRGLKPTWIRSSALGSGVPVYGDGSDLPPTAARVASQALNAAGVDPKDLDVVEVHDAFTIGEIIYAEALGICGPGEGGRYAAEGLSQPNGRGVAINPSGGLLSRGHPLGASGLAQVYELVSQLRGTAGSRQVEGARLAAAHNMGASVFELDANVCSVLVLEKG